MEQTSSIETKNYMRHEVKNQVITYRTCFFLCHIKINSQNYRTRHDLVDVISLFHAF